MNKIKVSPAAALAEAHRALSHELNNLGEVARPDSGATPAAVLARLQALRGHLGKHFRFEEESGYMQAVLARAPQQERRVRRLREEHDELWQALAALVQQAAAATALGEEFRQALADWAARLRDHERRENVLVEDTFNVEVSAAD
jgi:hypothetical protein